jgi:predicted phospho-2-dehydro-3-deoxyheptonate aldolase
LASAATRLRPLAKPSGAVVMLPLDHGVSVGPIPGFADPAAAAAVAAEGGATCVAVHKGLLRHLPPLKGRLGVLLHLSASTDLAPDPLDKRLVATVAEAARRGCDGVSIHVNFGSPTEGRQLEDAGRVADACDEHGLPLVTMAYVRGPHVKDPFDPAAVAHAARAAAELGADAVKVPYTRDFRDVVQGCPVPVLVAGGARRAAFPDFLRDVQSARAAGAAGLSVGRNVLQHSDPRGALRSLSALFP